MKSRNATGPRAKSAELLGTNTCDHSRLPLGSRNQDVQAPPAAFLAQRTEIEAWVTVCILSVTDTDHHYIALVALHVFQRFHEERLVGGGEIRERKNVRALFKSFLHGTLDSLLLLRIHGNNPERPVRKLSEMFND